MGEYKLFPYWLLLLTVDDVVFVIVGTYKYQNFLQKIPQKKLKKLYNQLTTNGGKYGDCIGFINEYW